MSVGPLGMIGSVAGSPLSQTKGTDVDRAAEETGSQARRTSTDQKAESASGVGQTEQDEQASDRDADGRRLWEPGQGAEDETESPHEKPDSSAQQSKDATGERGNQLDLSG